MVIWNYNARSEKHQIMLADKSFVLGQIKILGKRINELKIDSGRNKIQSALEEVLLPKVREFSLSPSAM